MSEQRPAGESGAEREPTFEQRMEEFGRQAEAAGERLGRQAEAAGERLGQQAEAFGERIARDAGVKRAGDVAARIWGVILLAVGLWFFADVTLGVDMPPIPWRDLWPVGLILLGVFVLIRGMNRRSA